MKSWDNRKGRKVQAVKFGAKKTGAKPFKASKLKTDRHGNPKGATFEQATGEEPTEYRQDRRFGSRRHRRG